MMICFFIILRTGMFRKKKTWVMFTTISLYKIYRYIRLFCFIRTSETGSKSLSSRFSGALLEPYCTRFPQLVPLVERLKPPEPSELKQQEARRSEAIPSVAIRHDEFDGI